ncbi:DcaP family trimeric outer membrane transporter [Maribellus mangrovi]|uniref:DcaP family trimeric outer membrane transporter n=1 Tax=Maribellus mangrovi TaxID=3133146 RepID=UPI0030EE8F63
MNSIKHRFHLIILSLFVVANLNAQVKDSIIHTRDDIGDMNAAVIRAGEFPGAITLPGSHVSLAIGGFIKATAIYDTKYSVKNEIIMPGTFKSSDFNEGQSYIGARSSRLFFDGRVTYDGLAIKGYYEMDFRGAYGFTLRHAYLQLNNKKGQSLLMGQYWSLVMDLKSIPEGLVEPTMSGGGFSRHGQIRFVTPLSNSLSLSISLEEPNSTDIKGEAILPQNRYADVIGFLSIDPSEAVHLGLTGMYRPLTYVVQSTRNKEVENGWLGNATAVFKPGAKDKIALSAMIGSGASNYIMGTDGTGAYYSENSLELQVERGGFGSIGHKWNEKLRSNLALGMFHADELDTNPNPHIKSSTFGFVNTFYRLNKYVNVGIEWLYTNKKQFNGEGFTNNRIQFGIQIF